MQLPNTKPHASFNLLDLVPACILKQNVGPTLALARLHHLAYLPHNVPSSPSETTSQTVETIVPYRQRLCLCPHLFCRCCAWGIPCGNAPCATPAKNHSGRRRRHYPIVTKVPHPLATFPPATKGTTLGVYEIVVVSL